jgi:hypothetical protein
LVRGQDKAKPVEGAVAAINQHDAIPHGRESLKFSDACRARELIMARIIAPNPPETAGADQT